MIKERIKARHPSVREHEDLNFLNNRTKFKGIADVLIDAKYKPEDSDLTHLLIMKKWDSNFIFNNISKDGKNFIEAAISQDFFSSGKQLAGITEEDEADDD